MSPLRRALRIPSLLKLLLDTTAQSAPRREQQHKTTRADGSLGAGLPPRSAPTLDVARGEPTRFAFLTDPRERTPVYWSGCRVLPVLNKDCALDCVRAGRTGRRRNPVRPRTFIASPVPAAFEVGESLDDTGLFQACICRQVVGSDNPSRSSRSLAVTTGWRPGGRRSSRLQYPSGL